MTYVGYFQCDRTGCPSTTEDLAGSRWITVLIGEPFLPSPHSKHMYVCSVYCAKWAADKLGEKK